MGVQKHNIISATSNVLRAHHAKNYDNRASVFSKALWKMGLKFLEDRNLAENGTAKLFHALFMKHKLFVILGGGDGKL